MISRLCFPENGKEMYKVIKRMRSAVVLPVGSFVLPRP